MRMPILAGLGFCLSFAQPAAAQSMRAVAATPEHGAQLFVGPAEEPRYRLECRANEVAVTQFGVTKLMDFASGQKIGDTPGSAITRTAAMMALYAGKGTPDLVPADASSNPKAGWDLTIHLRKDDKNLRALRKAEMISLFTTGTTTAIPMDDADRALAAQFLDQCKGA